MRFCSRNVHQLELWLPAYRKYADNLYAESRTLARCANNAVAYAKVSKELRNLKQSL